MIGTWNGKGKPPETLPFSERRQEAALGHMIQDVEFFMQCRHRVKPDWFVGSVLQKLWTAMLGCADKYNRPPTLEEILESPSTVAEDQAMKNRLIEKVHQCVGATKLFPLDAIKSDLTAWVKARAVCTSLERQIQTYNEVAQGRRDLGELISEIKDVSRKIDEVQFDDTIRWNFDNLPKQFEESRMETNFAMTTGLGTLDKCLLPGAKFGSLLTKNMTVFLAPMGVGKTTALVTTACANIMAGKRVMFVIHEGKPEQVRDKILRCLLYQADVDRGVDKDDMWSMGTTPEGRRLLDKYSAQLREKLAFIPYSMAGMSVEEVGSVIRQECMKEQDRTGQKFDMVVDDYASCLFTSRNKGGLMQDRIAIKTVYEYLLHLAQELDVHMLTAQQVNREGAKVMKRQDGRKQRLLVAEDAEESYGPMQKADNVISINRDEHAARNNYITLYVCKNRDGEGGHAVMCDSRYNYSVSFHNQLRSAWYWGTSTKADKVTSLLSSYRGQQIPAHELADAKDKG